MTTFSCPYLRGIVELSKEREAHIEENHPDLLPEFRDKLRAVLAEPDEIRISERFRDARLFSKWFDQVRGGKHIVIVVILEDKPHIRNWIVTAYITRKLSGGRTQWKAS